MPLTGLDDERRRLDSLRYVFRRLDSLRYVFRRPDSLRYF